MKAIIVSDTHGLEAILNEVSERHSDADLLIHCGDSELTKAHANLSNFKVVKGNVDFPSAGFPDQLVVEAGDIKWLIVHGHQDGVHRGLLNLNYKAEELDAKLICFGHTHMASATLYKDRIFINPGSLNSPRDRVEKTYSVCEWAEQETTFKVSFYTDKGEELQNLTQTFSL